MIIINHLAKLIRCDCIGLLTWYKCFLLDQISLNIKIIDSDTDFSFVFATIHISIHSKCKITTIVHTDDTYCMLIIQIPFICRICICKSENI